MDLDFLPNKIYNAISKLDFDKLYHIRLRVGFAIAIIYNSQKLFLGQNGVTLSTTNAIICNINDINEIVANVTERSLYAFNEKIKQGYISTKNGVRIGLLGECVFDKGQIITIKNIDGLSIRVPHEIVGSANLVIEKVVCNNEVSNSLIISPPGYGKTTILKDLAMQLNYKYKYSILIIDERGEFSNISGENIDVIRYSDKLFAFNYSIRSIAPEIVITDELCTIEDWNAVKYCANCGVKVIASCHGKDINDVKNKDFFIENVFDRYVVLDSKNIPGQVVKVYDGRLNLL